ncbi:DNA internalization-related competence protein ComEC/Rec2 [Salibacterium halotolerans]|uniref:Competence protein ComEC n=1 Tax=Salibacterium halotolerans TaxID=1884432 RepID=A0A1I5NEG1_9BACI|nr:DNA internalization-related competence protein ComEC/Rec2 [Salibacterium halotolerans]SFP20163.1 competence protein ComEC [Salibacterium halotolerans]
MKNDTVWFVLSGAAAVHLIVSQEIWVLGAAACPLVLLLARKRALPAVLLLLLFLLFSLRTVWAEHAHESSLMGKESVIQGTIEEGPHRDGSLVRYTLQMINRERVQVRLMLQEKTEIPVSAAYSPGRICSIQGTLRRPSKASNFHAFDYRQYLKQQHTYWEMKVDSVKDIRCSGSSRTPPHVLKTWRYDGIQHIDTVFPQSLRGIAAALLFGERHLLDADTETDYQSLGLIHLLAVSGLHVGLLSAMLYFLLLKAGMTREKAEWILLILLPIYAVSAGAAPSVLRAVSMVSAFIIWNKTGRKRIDPFFVLCFAALLFLWIHPYYLYHIGFQLSFLISASLLLSRTILSQKSKWKAAVYVSVIAQCAGLPIILYHFFEFSFLSILLNLVFVPFISVIVLPGVILLFVLSFLNTSLFSVAVVPLEVSVSMVHQLLADVGSWNVFTYTSGKPALVVTGMLAAAVYFFFLRLEEKRSYRRLLLPVLFVAGILTFQKVLPYMDSQGRVTMLDVGQGDSFLVELPYRRAVYLIDTGGVPEFPKEEWKKREAPYDPGEDVVVPFLKAEGITKLDKLIITHGDIDHYGGARAVIEDMEVKEVLYGKGGDFKKAESAFLHGIWKRDIPVVPVKQGMAWDEAGGSFQVLAPHGDEPAGNERSIVLQAELGDRKWLFTGDIGREGEEELLSDFPDIEADILKVGHHGSRTSSSPSFIEELGIKAALISAGRCNRFGHPHEETLKTLETAGAQIHQTDEAGAVQISFTKDGIQSLRTALPAAEPNCEES